MPIYRIHYLKDQAAIDRFRTQGPPDGPSSLKPKDYILVGEIEAPHEYAVWKQLQGEGAAAMNLRPMGVGDVIEIEPGRPRLLRFSGFDEAGWFTFEPKPKGEGSATPSPESSETPSAAPAPDIQSNPSQ